MQEIKCGDIVYLQKYSNMLAEVLDLLEGKALIKFCDTGLEALLRVEELGCTYCNQPHAVSGSIVNILGVPYTIIIEERGIYSDDGSADGWCDFTTKEIIAFNYRQDVSSSRDLIRYQHKVIRHEIVHAFLYESGLAENSLSCDAWAKNEEMVDWLAIQIPKIYKAFAEAGVTGWWKDEGGGVMYVVGSNS